MILGIDDHGLSEQTLIKNRNKFSGILIVLQIS